MSKWNPQPLIFTASSHIKLFYLRWFLIVWWPFERRSCRKNPAKPHSNMKYSNNVQNISYTEGGSASKEATFHLRFQLLEELFMVNESLIPYRTILSSFSPTLPKVPPQNLKCLLFLPSWDMINQNMRFGEYGLLPAYQQPTALGVLFVQAHALKMWNPNSFLYSRAFLPWVG